MAGRQAPTSHLYKNNRDGTFTDVTEKSGLARTGWQTGVCVGDYDNDGFDDLFCCFWGHNILFHNNGDGTFTDVTREGGRLQRRNPLGRGLLFLDYDRDGRLDLFVCNYIKLDPAKTPDAERRSRLPVEGHPGHVRAARPSRRHQRSLSQQWRRNLYRRLGKIRHFETRPALLHHPGLRRFRQRRLAGHLRGRRFAAQHAASKQSRRHLHRHRRA